MRRISSRFVNKIVPAAATAPQFVRSYTTAAPEKDAKAEEPKAEEKPAADETKKLDSKHEQTIKELRKELKEKDEKFADLKKDYVYQCAETENVRRIGREDVEKARSFGVQSFGKDILDVGDSLERAIEAFQKMPHEELDSNKTIQSIYTGVKMSSSVMLSVLGKHNIEKIDLKIGETFDPNRHEALFQAPATTDVPPNHITAQVKTGYMIKDRVLRAAQVGVAME